MHEQYGTTGVARLTCCCGPVHDIRPEPAYDNGNCSQVRARLAGVPRFMNEGKAEEPSVDAEGT